MEFDEERELAISLFNHAWSLLDLANRTPREDDDLIHCTHASRWHWGRVGSAREWAIGEWQCSRVYAVLGRSEPSLFHAQRCVDLCAEFELDGFIVASAHEAMARALAVRGDYEAASAEREIAAGLAVRLTDLDDRAVVEADIATLPIP